MTRITGAGVCVEMTLIACLFIIIQLFHAFAGQQSKLLPKMLWTASRPRAKVHRFVHSTEGDRSDYCLHKARNSCFITLSM